MIRAQEEEAAPESRAPRVSIGSAPTVADAAASARTHTRDQRLVDQLENSIAMSILDNRHDSA